MLLVIDNYDSFTYNLVQYLRELGQTVQVERNDALDVAAICALGAERIVLSPGPCTPTEAGVCVPLIQALAGRVPLLGVCLGHQSIGAAFGAAIVRAPTVMHGKVDTLSHDNTGVFAHLPPTFQVARYHSLMVDSDSLSADFQITARTNDGVIMGMRHKIWPLEGVQFHPESIATEHGHALLANFLKLAL